MSGFQVRIVSVSALCAALCLGAGAPARATAIAGWTGGEFVHPFGPPTMRATGAGTDLFTWGVSTGWQPPSLLRLSGVPVSTQVDVPFSFGVLSYFNSTTMFGTEATRVDLAVSLTLEGPERVTRSFEYPLHLINRLNTSDPIQSADSVLCPISFPTAGFSLGGIDYTLAFDGFRNVAARPPRRLPDRDGPHAGQRLE